MFCPVEFVSVLRPICKPHTAPLRGFCPVIIESVLRPAYKPHFVQRMEVGLRSEEGRPNAPPGRSSLWAAYPGLLATRAASRPCLALLPAGVAWPPALLRTPVVSYTAFSPSPPCGGSLFLWPCSGRLPRPGISPAPCSVECGLSSTRRRSAGPRSPGRPEDGFIIPVLVPCVNTRIRIRLDRSW